LAKEALLVGSDNDLMRVDNKHEQTTIASMKLDATFGGGADQNLIRWRGSFFAAIWALSNSSQLSHKCTLHRYNQAFQN